MAERLWANRRKGGWDATTTEYLFRRLLDEVAELYAAWHVSGADPTHEAVERECADVANFAMMIAERSK